VRASISQNWASTIYYTDRFTFPFFKWRSKAIGKAFLLVSECAITKPLIIRRRRSRRSRRRRRRKLCYITSTEFCSEMEKVKYGNILRTDGDAHNLDFLEED
jgi:hypothetical protein